MAPATALKAKDQGLSPDELCYGIYAGDHYLYVTESLVAWFCQGLNAHSSTTTY